MGQPENQGVTSARGPELSAVKQALLEVRQLRNRLDQMEQARSEPIAIIGIGCRFPGGVDGPDSFWQLLEQGVDAITEVPPDRWDIDAYYDANPQAPGKMASRWGGFLEQVDRFDAPFFGIAPREAAAMDPQQRLLLEVSWEALEQAGQSPAQLFGSQTGVFIGISTIDYAHILFGQSLAEIDAYAGVGFSHSIAAGRLAYVLGVQGPTVAIDTACSSSLVAVHQAVQNLRLGTCSMALAGGVNLILRPDLGVTFSKAQMLSPDGRCKTFDARADGYVRSEGCGMVVLKRLSDAIADRDQILALIRGSAINHDGRSSGITAPNGPSQTAVIRAALADGHLKPEQVAYVETHGTGTSLGDPIEVQALYQAVGQGRTATQPLQIGSVKTNLGHLEAAAGIASLIKAVLVLQHEQIPPHLHLQQLNPYIAWDSLPITVPTQTTPLMGSADCPLVGVSSFGFSGTNAHLVLSTAPAPVSPDPTPDRPCHLFTLSVKRQSDLPALLQRYDSFLSTTTASLADICFTANGGRLALVDRVALVVADRAELRQKLLTLAAGQSPAGCLRGQVFETASPEITFGFSGATNRLLQAGQQLFQTQPQFRSLLEQCDALLRSHLDVPLLEVLYPTGSSVLLDRPAYAQPALFALNYALAQLWQSWGIRPTLVTGQGAGEIVAACVAGALPLEVGLALAVLQGQNLEQPSTPLADRLTTLLASVPATTPPIGIISGVTGQFVAATELTQPSYWLQLWQQPPAWGRVLQTLAAQNQTLCLEIGPHPDLSLLERSAYPDSIWFSSLHIDREDWLSLLENLAALYVRGLPIDWIAFDQPYPRQRLALPTYPWAKEPYWIETSAPPLLGQPPSLWDQITTAGTQQAQQGPLDLALDTYADRWACLERLTVAYIIQTLQTLGAFAQTGDRASVDALLTQLQIRPTYRPLLLRWLKHLVAAQLLQTVGDEFIALQPLPPAALAEAKQAAQQSLTAEQPLLTYVERCGDRLAPILTGTASALDTLFPEGSLETANYLYRDWAMIRYFSGIMQQIVASLVRLTPADRPLQILEIGAGTGGTAAVLLPLLPPERTHYQFTDVSDFFLGRAAEKFRAYPFVRYSLLNVEQDPQEQGYTPASVDLIVAANVLHATQDLRSTLKHARSLLAPGGLLILFEVTTHLTWFDITTGLIEGWERFEDDWRQDDPLLPASTWQQALQEAGFEQVIAFPQAGSAAEILGAHVMVAQTSLAAASAARGQPVQRTASPLPEVAPSPPIAPADLLRQDLLAALPDERRERLTQFVREQVAAVLRSPIEGLHPRHRLMDIGVDSLMAVDLRNRLQTGLGLTQTIPATLMFDYPTIAAIASYLEGLLTPSPQAPAPVPSPDSPEGPPPAPATLPDLEQLSDQEVEALLLEKLNQL
ncbi:hypothetical protein BST81_00795 [Leptolyngbya sp. 'hensonii']|uniref:type I polyketide synthase n=1 Tax=Leptolyngbya sp. 'hensonii' TaxID=1922337 RepID=UPI0009502AAE|nr:type I polyketide synthase [Leptolyngbya sp. 'hensonii']OLP20308.1 hypothetical protein BST81_00795 [Leptolyngbya sp. 'hensonii']